MSLRSYTLSQARVYQIDAANRTMVRTMKTRSHIQHLLLESCHRAGDDDGLGPRRATSAARKYRRGGTVAAAFEFQDQVLCRAVLIRQRFTGQSLGRPADSVVRIVESLDAHSERMPFVECIASESGNSEPVRSRVAGKLLVSAVERAANAQRRRGLERRNQIAEVPPMRVVVR